MGGTPSLENDAAPDLAHVRISLPDFQRARRERNETGDFWKDEGERKRKRVEEEERRVEKERIHAIAMAEVARRPDADAA